MSNQQKKEQTSVQIIIPEESNNLTVKDFFNQDFIKERFKNAYQNNEMAQKALSVISIECTKSKALAECSKQSLLQAGLDAANFGLIPNKMAGHCYLIPRYNSTTKQTEATLQLGYKGYVKKFEESGWTVEVELVTQEEIDTHRFEEIRGLTTSLTYRPMRSGLKTKDNIALGYAIAKKQDRYPVIIVMSLEEIMESAKTLKYDKAQKKMVADLGSVWSSEDRETDFGQMCKKTLIIRLGSVCPVETVSIMSSYEFERDNLDELTEKDKNKLSLSSDPVAERMNKEKMAAKIEDVDLASNEVEKEEVKDEPAYKEPKSQKEYLEPESNLGIQIFIQGKPLSGFADIQEAHTTLKQAMSRLKMKNDRERLLKENSALITNLDKLKLPTLADELYKIKNEGEINVE